jgi:peptidoglycan-associated lipoprotein
LLAVFLMIAVSGVAGCKKQKGLGEDESGAAAAGIGEEGLPGGGHGSLDAAQSGMVGAGGPLQDVHFDYDSFELGDDARQTLKRNAEWLGSNRGARVEIEGHCDDRGTVEYNLALGSKRAAAAKSYLVSLGISPERLTTISYGEELPLCHEQTESCWQENRRARLVVTNN